MYIVQGEPCSLKCTILFTVRRLGICKYTQVEAASVKLCNPRRAGTFIILQKKVKTDLIILNLLRPNFFWSSSNEMWKLLISNIWGITYLGINDPRYKGGERWGQDVQNCKCFHPTGFSFSVNSYQPSMRSKQAQPYCRHKIHFWQLCLWRNFVEVSAAKVASLRARECGSAQLVCTPSGSRSIRRWCYPICILQIMPHLTINPWHNLCCQTYESESEDQVISGSEVEAIWLGWSVYNLIVIGFILEKLHQLHSCWYCGLTTLELWFIWYERTNKG